MSSEFQQTILDAQQKVDNVAMQTNRMSSLLDINDNLDQLVDTVKTTAHSYNNTLYSTASVSRRKELQNSFTRLSNSLNDILEKSKTFLQRYTNANDESQHVDDNTVLYLRNTLQNMQKPLNQFRVVLENHNEDEPRVSNMGIKTHIQFEQDMTDQRKLRVNYEDRRRRRRVHRIDKTNVIDNLFETYMIGQYHIADIYPRSPHTFHTVEQKPSILTFCLQNTSKTIEAYLIPMNECSLIYPKGFLDAVYKNNSAVYRCLVTTSQQRTFVTHGRAPPRMELWCNRRFYGINPHGEIVYNRQSEAFVYHDKQTNHFCLYHTQTNRVCRASNKDVYNLFSVAQDTKDINWLKKFAVTIGIVDANPVMKLYDVSQDKSHDVYVVFTPDGLYTNIRVTNQGVFIPDTIVSLFQRQQISHDIILAFVKEQRSFCTDQNHQTTIDWITHGITYTLGVSEGHLFIIDDEDL